MSEVAKPCGCADSILECRDCKGCEECCCCGGIYKRADIKDS